ncbi:MAG: hypothetical protein EPO63_04975 [Candidatus Nitrosotenuis sp.]|nr:MAG: hypothetical protein EPO63_04975 [Candidatus Nitrosotenuis sp.]
MQESSLWFTHVDEEWNVDNDHKHVKFTGNKKTWNWKNCFFSAIKEQDRIRVTVRSFGYVQSKLHEKQSTINFEYDFTISEIPKPAPSDHLEPLGNTGAKQYSDNKYPSYELVLTKENEADPDKKKCVIWEWSNDVPLKETNVYKVYTMLQDVQTGSSGGTEKPNNVIPFLPFSDQEDLPEQVLPIIYQPAIDTLKNFIRQIHIFKISDIEYEVTLIFNNEELRDSKIFQEFYNVIRPEIYGRTEDVESFRIMLVDGLPKQFTFEGIYSGNHGICADTIHGDKRHWWNIGGPKKRPILYFLASNRHPKVFVNTSNHALAQHDNNKNLWKWEYLTWGKDNPVVVGHKRKDEVNALLNDFHESLRVEVIKSEIQKNHDEHDLDNIAGKYRTFAEKEFLVSPRLANELVRMAINKIKNPA